MLQSFNVLRAKRTKNDEFYTTMEHVEYIFKNYFIDDRFTKDKVIYCPCDSEDSNFIKYITSHKDVLGYKELIYTWDDYNTHLDLFEKADIIITNPPFSKLCKEFIPILNKINKQFFIFGAYVSLLSYYNRFTINNLRILAYAGRNHKYKFILPDGTTKELPFIYLTNMDVPDVAQFNKKHVQPKYNITATLDDGNEYKIYKIMKHVPLDYYEPCLVPISVLFDQWKEDFDIISIKPKVVRYSDGLSRYSTILVKRKHIND